MGIDNCYVLKLKLVTRNVDTFKLIFYKRQEKNDS